MASENNGNGNENGNDETNNSGKQKITQNSLGVRTRRGPQGTHICPRCNSTRTKFCYFNNYSVTQPRYFCKNCRRYWTEGGALRNVPVGGGYRKTKKIKTAAPPPPPTTTYSTDQIGGGLRYFESILRPALNFQVGGTTGFGFNGSHHYNNRHQASTSTNPITQLYHVNNVNNTFTLIPSFGEAPTAPNPPNPPTPAFTSTFTLQPLPNYTFNGGTQSMGSNGGFNSNVSSTFESLSTQNQTMHYQLQEERFAGMFAGVGSSRENQNQTVQYNNQPCLEYQVVNQVVNPVQTVPQNFIFQNLESTEAPAEQVTGDTRGLATEWLFDNSFASPQENQNQNPTQPGPPQNTDEAIRRLIFGDGTNWNEVPNLFNQNQINNGRGVTEGTNNENGLINGSNWISTTGVSAPQVNQNGNGASTNTSSSNGEGTNWNGVQAWYDLNKKN